KALQRAAERDEIPHRGMLGQLEHDAARGEPLAREEVEELAARQVRVVDRIGLDVEEEQLVRTEAREHLDRLPTAEALGRPEGIVRLGRLEHHLDGLESSAPYPGERLETEHAAVDDVDDRLVDGADQAEVQDARELHRMAPPLALLLPEGVGERLLERPVD